MLDAEGIEETDEVGLSRLLATRGEFEGRDLEACLAQVFEVSVKVLEPRVAEPNLLKGKTTQLVPHDFDCVLNESFFDSALGTNADDEALGSLFEERSVGSEHLAKVRVPRNLQGAATDDVELDGLFPAVVAESEMGERLVTTDEEGYVEATMLENGLEML